MATYTWYTEGSNFPCTLNDPPTTLVDQIRTLIGDTNGVPVAYLSDGQINLIASYHNEDLYTSAAECAEACAGRCLSLHESVKQGHRLEIKNFDPEKAYKAFLDLANMLRDKSTIGTLPSYGTLAGKVCTSPANPRRHPSWVN